MTDEHDGFMPNAAPQVVPPGSAGEIVVDDASTTGTLAGAAPAPTPRTDAALEASVIGGMLSVIPVMRQLERELAAAVAQRDEARAVYARMCDGLIDEKVIAAIDRAEKAEAALAEKDAEIARLRDDAGYLWHALKDLSFDCDGITQTNAPQRGTYNSTFAVLQSLSDKYQASPHYQTRVAGKPIDAAKEGKP